MRRVILNHSDGTKSSFRCKSETRAKEIAAKRPDVISYKYYRDGEYIPRPKRQIKEKASMSIEEMESIIKNL